MTDTTDTTANTAADLAAARAELAQYKAKAEVDGQAAAKAQADGQAAAEVERQAKLTADQRVQEELAKQRNDLDATRAQLRKDARYLALDRAGVLPKYRSFAPDTDPRQQDGAKALEAWIKEHPELADPAARGATGQQQQPLGVLEMIKARSQPLADVLTGKRKSHLVTEASLRKMLDT